MTKSIPSANLEASRRNRVNILIVDDEPNNLTVLETVLDDPDYHFVRATSADEALLALVVNEFALLILDIRMPEMTGFELAQMIRLRRKNARVPIIFLTAYYNEDQHVAEGYHSGAVDYLHKPINAAILRSKVAVFADLYRKSCEVEMKNLELQQLNDTLEQRVMDRTAALMEADRRKDEYLAILAHELRNPLAPIRNALQILKGGLLATSEAEWAHGIMDRQLKSMTKLIDDLMDLSRINQGKITLQSDVALLNSVVEEAVETSRSYFNIRRHDLIFVPGNEPIHVCVDRTRLVQVLLNLLSNAAKFSPPESSVIVSIRRMDTQAVISVKDEGVGISAENRDKIFLLFSQVDASLTRCQGGLGIGLHIVRRLVEMHGGRIEVFSEGENLGSEFSVFLPLVPGKTAAANPPSPAPSASAGGHLRVLIADDNSDAAATLAMLLQAQGHTVFTAWDGIEALNCAIREAPHVAILDIGMPKLSGYDTAKAIRLQVPDRSMLLIAATGWGQESDRQKSKAAGFDYHLVKPLNLEDLQGILHKLAP